MKRSILIAVVLVLTALGVGLAWQLSRQEAVAITAELVLPLAGNGPELEAAADTTVIPMPEAGPAVAEHDADQSALAVDQRRPVSRPPPPDYAAIYEGWPSVRLYERSAELKESVKSAISARFDELHARFDQYYANHQYGARVTEVGKAFENVEVEIGPGHHYSARTVEGPDGSFAMNVLDFFASEVPATAQLVAELEWVRAKLGE